MKIDAIQKVIDHKQFINGPEVVELEQKLADYVGVEYAIGCGSGTDALVLALRAIGLQPGQKVVTTPFSFVATAEAIVRCGGVVVYGEISEDTFNLDPYDLASRLIRDEFGKGVVGILSVDLFGLPCDYDALNSIAHHHGLWIIQDSAQAFGASYKGQQVPSQGRIGCTSFFPTKPLGCMGDGGMCFTNDKWLANELYSLREHGRGKDKYNPINIGYNSRLDTIQAAVLLHKLRTFCLDQAVQEAEALSYAKKFSDVDVKHPSGFDTGRAWAQYTVLAKDRKVRDELLHDYEHWKPRIYYPNPLYKFLPYRKEIKRPVTESVCERVLSFPTVKL